MRFQVVAQKSGLALGEYDETAPLIRLVEGKPHVGQKRPLDLMPGEQTVVAYPMDRRGDERFVCRVTRVDGAPAQPDEQSRKADVLAERQTAVAAAVKEVPPHARRRVARLA